MGGGNTGTILGIVGAVVGFVYGGPAGAALGMAVGEAVGNAIDPPVTPGPELGDSSAQTSRAGHPIPDVWGTVSCSGNIIQMNPIKKITKEVGSKKARTTETRAYRTFAIGFARAYNGPIAGYLRIWENEKLVVDLRPDPEIPIAETNAYLEGITIYLGGEDQMPDGDLESYTGVGFTPAYRGLSYIVWKEKDITDFGQAIPAYKVELTTSQPLIATSNIYPFDADDALEFSVEFSGGSLSDIPTDAIDLSYNIVSGTLETLLYDTGPYPDEMDLSYNIVSGSLITILNETGPYPDEMDLTYSFLDGTLDTVLVEYVAEDEAMQMGAVFHSGVMT